VEAESRLSREGLQDVQLSQIQRRYRMMFGSMAPELTRLQIWAVWP